MVVTSISGKGAVRLGALVVKSDGGGWLIAMDDGSVLAVETSLGGLEVVCARA